MDAILHEQRSLQHLDAEQLRHRCCEWQRLAAVQTPRYRAAETCIQVHALTAEATRRALGKQFYEVQLLAGLALANGCVAQMQTGEGKTLTTLLPAVYFAIHGRGVHVATTNTYLAARDHEELRPALDLLGLTSAVLPDPRDEAAKRRAYRQDVTFGAGYDFGFDFLRDQISVRRQAAVPLGDELFSRLTNRPVSAVSPLQRPLAYAIVDEADSVLIDEGTMPLILSGTTGHPASPRILQLAADTAARLTSQDVELDKSTRGIQFTSSGWDRIHADLAGLDLPLRRQWSVYVENALRATHFLRRDIDYVVRDDSIQIVDPQTGRIHSERTWRDGLHQAIEFREGVKLTLERVSEARITRQRYFQRYERIAGLTGTAQGVESELRGCYGMTTVVIPTHRPSRRDHRPPRFFANSAARDQAMIAEVCVERRLGRPTLVGTRTIEHSRQLAALLGAAGVPHVLLNGVQDREEAEIVSQAGQSGVVTIATNMAGRGTDIRLDAAARAAGGLHVIAAEHHASPRVDRQLAGRAGRQGDVGSCRVFVSADDELLARHSPALAARLRETADDTGESHCDFSNAIRNLQQRLEREAGRSREQMVARDHWQDDVLRVLASTAGPD